MQHWCNHINNTPKLEYYSLIKKPFVLKSILTGRAQVIKMAVALVFFISLLKIKLFQGFNE